jgi:hypothetical protein
MRDYVRTTEDYGGVHINSGILNHAFYRMVMALDTEEATWRMGSLWFRALTTRWDVRTDFAAAVHTVMVLAEEQYGAGSREAEAVAAGFDAVGLPPDAPAPPSGPPAEPERSPCEPALEGLVRAATRAAEAAALTTIRLVAPEAQRLLRDAVAHELRAARRDNPNPRGDPR